jgi:hypothetical protein
MLQDQPDNWYAEERECAQLRQGGADPTHENWGNLTAAVSALLGRVDEDWKALSQVSKLTARVDTLEAKLTDLSTSGSIIVPISTLVPAPFDLLKEIKAVVRPCDDDFVASFFDANVNASGCTIADAVRNLKDMLTTRFDILDAMPIEKLGPAMVRQIAVLRNFIRRRA